MGSTIPLMGKKRIVTVILVGLLILTFVMAYVPLIFVGR